MLNISKVLTISRTCLKQSLSIMASLKCFLTDESMQGVASVVSLSFETVTKGWGTP